MRVFSGAISPIKCLFINGSRSVHVSVSRWGRLSVKAIFPDIPNSRVQALKRRQPPFSLALSGPCEAPCDDFLTSLRRRRRQQNTVLALCKAIYYMET